MKKILSSNDKMPFGKYKGWKINNLPYSYIIWLDRVVKTIQLDSTIVSNAWNLHDQIQKQRRTKLRSPEWEDFSKQELMSAIEYY